MEIPFLKNKQNGNGTAMGAVKIAQTSDHPSDLALMDGIADELLTAIEKKDIRSLRESLKALVLHLRRQDEDQTEKS